MNKINGNLLFEFEGFKPIVGKNGYIKTLFI